MSGRPLDRLCFLLALLISPCPHGFDERRAREDSIGRHHRLSGLTRKPIPGHASRNCCRAAFPELRQRTRNIHPLLAPPYVIKVQTSNASPASIAKNAVPQRLGMHFLFEGEGRWLRAGVRWVRTNVQGMAQLIPAALRHTWHPFFRFLVVRIVRIVRIEPHPRHSCQQNSTGAFGWRTESPPNPAARLTGVAVRRPDVRWLPRLSPDLRHGTNDPCGSPAYMAPFLSIPGSADCADCAD
jgi:hypothetical protein